MSGLIELTPATAFASTFLEQVHRAETLVLACPRSPDSISLATNRRGCDRSTSEALKRYSSQPISFLIGATCASVLQRFSHGMPSPSASARVYPLHQRITTSRQLRTALQLLVLMVGITLVPAAAALAVAAIRPTGATGWRAEERHRPRLPGAPYAIQPAPETFRPKAPLSPPWPRLSRQHNDRLNISCIRSPSRVGPSPG